MTIKYPIHLPILLILALSCSAEPQTRSPNSSEASPDTLTQEEPFSYEVSSSDSGLIEGVNPEEIITDDWSDEGDIELEIEE